MAASAPTRTAPFHSLVICMALLSWDRSRLSLSDRPGWWRAELMCFTCRVKTCHAGAQVACPPPQKKSKGGGAHPSPSPTHPLHPDGIRGSASGRPTEPRGDWRPTRPVRASGAPPRRRHGPGAALGPARPAGPAHRRRCRLKLAARSGGPRAAAEGQRCS
eukprot:361791-Chlamydomonas_euryale.AAC.11